MIRNILLVGLGGGIGSIARYLCYKLAERIYPQSFPWGTFFVNLSGCFLIGLLWGLQFRSSSSNDEWKLFAMVGICGGFTTFSAFSVEGIELIKQNKTGLFLLYAIGSVATGLLATWIGMRLTR